MQIANSLSRIEKLSRGWASGFVAFIIIWALSLTPVLTLIENFAGDVLRRNLAQEYVSPIEIVYLDDVSLKLAESEFGLPFPWPREAYGQAVRYLHEAGARAIIFDFLFTSHSPSGREDDLIFSKAAAKAGMVFAGLQIIDADQPESAKRVSLQPDLYTVPVKGRILHAGYGIDASYPPLWGGLKGLGDVNFQQDPDGINRKARLLSLLGEQTYPSLALSAVWNIQGRPEILVEPGRLSIGGRAFALDEEGYFNILFRKIPGRESSTRLIDLVMGGAALAEGLKPQLDPARFKDKIVIIGSNAPGLLDLRPSPLQKRVPGVLMQANLIDNLLAGENLKTMPMRWWMWLLLYMMVNLIARFSFSLRGPGVVLPTAILALLWATAAVWMYQSHATLIPIGTALSACVAAFGFTTFEHWMLERRQRGRVQNIFGQFLSPAVLKKLNTGASELETGGETKDLAVFFSDLAGFTSFSEKLSPHQLVVILNEYLEEMADVVVGRHDGYVDKYIGDAIMAIWGAPTPHSEPALAATRAAWHSQVRLAEIQDHLKELGLDAGEEGLVMRIGINYGPCVVGLMGSRRKLNYTVMGDTVNTASRLEGANKPYGTRIMLSDSAKEACGDKILTRVMDFLRVKGKAEPTTVHELIGLSDEPGALYTPDYVARFHAAMDLYRKAKFSQAKAALEALLKEKPKDGVAAVYIHRCEEYLEHPPEAGWDGVYVMKTK